MPRKADPSGDLDALRTAIRSSPRSAADIAADAGISRVYMYQILSGAKTPSAHVRQRIVDALAPAAAAQGGAESTILFELLSIPERAYRIWLTAQDLLKADFAACRDDTERHRFLETLWVPMRLTWWLRGSAERVARYREEVPPSSSLDRFGYWLATRGDVEDHLACVLGLLCWREPELTFAMIRAGQPAAFDLAPHKDLIPPELWEAAFPSQS